MRVLVAGVFSAGPGQGGVTWAFLQYVRGLEQLGHEVLAVDAPAGRTTLAPEEVSDFDADLLLNLSGVLRDRDLIARFPTRVYVDLDPVFVQLWHAQGVDVGLEGHTHYATVAQALERSRIPIDRRWIPTLPPVVLSDWPYASEDPMHDAFTTVGNWRSYGSIQWGDAFYGQRAHAMRRLLPLPSLTSEPLLPALAIHPAEEADLRALADHGWRLADPAAVAATPDDYRRFVAGSKGELGIAKAGYVDSRCGWFSDRSACYLAAGRPVVAQDTGLRKALPCGEGLLSFTTAVQAAAAIDLVCSDYERHRRAARAIAEEYLDSDVVLNRLLEMVL